MKCEYKIKKLIGLYISELPQTLPQFYILI